MISEDSVGNIIFLPDDKLGYREFAATCAFEALHYHNMTPDNFAKDALVCGFGRNDIIGLGNELGLDTDALSNSIKDKYDELKYGCNKQIADDLQSDLKERIAFDKDVMKAVSWLQENNIDHLGNEFNEALKRDLSAKPFLNEASVELALRIVNKDGGPLRGKTVLGFKDNVLDMASGIIVAGQHDMVVDAFKDVRKEIRREKTVMNAQQLYKAFSSGNSLSQSNGISK